MLGPIRMSNPEPGPADLGQMLFMLELSLSMPAWYTVVSCWFQVSLCPAATPWHQADGGAGLLVRTQTRHMHDSDPHTHVVETSTNTLALLHRCSKCRRDDVVYTHTHTHTQSGEIRGIK